jgi:hypothetical protein
MEGSAWILDFKLLAYQGILFHFKQAALLHLKAPGCWGWA